MRPAKVRPSRRAIRSPRPDPVGPLVPRFGCRHWQLTAITRRDTGAAAARGIAARHRPARCRQRPAGGACRPHRHKGAMLEPTPHDPSTTCAACARRTTRRSRSTSTVRTASGAAMAATPSSRRDRTTGPSPVSLIARGEGVSPQPRLAPQPQRANSAQSRKIRTGGRDARERTNIQYFSIGSDWRIGRISRRTDGESSLLLPDMSNLSKTCHPRGEGDCGSLNARNSGFCRPVGRSRDP